MLLTLVSTLLAATSFVALPSASAAALATTTNDTRTRIIVPLYSYSEACWPELQTAARANPSVSYIVIINPDSGPGTSDPSDPSVYCVPVLRQVLPSSSIFVGYVRTGYNERSVGDVEKDVKAYAKWKQIKVDSTRTNATTTAGLDGIFFDETSDTTTKRLQAFASIAKTSFSNRLVKIISNPGTAVGSPYFANANYVVDYESALSDYKFSNLPTSSASQLRQSVVMVHDFDNSTTSLASVLKPLVVDARVGAVYVTDLKIAETDVYGKFGTDWQQFVETVASLNKVA